MTPPSAMANGGSSLMDLLKRSPKSASGSSRPSRSAKRAALRCPRAKPIAGSRAIETRKDVNSRGPAVPTLILPSNRSTSNMLSNDDRASSSATAEPASSPTASRRDAISTGSIDGRTSQFRSRRAPMPVRVRLITPSKVSFAEPFDGWDASKSSRFRIVDRSSIK